MKQIHTHIHIQYSWQVSQTPHEITQHVNKKVYGVILAFWMW